MYKYGKTSTSRLETCCTKLQRLGRELIKYRDVSILCGYRNEEDQNIAFYKGKSKVKYPDSAHNMSPSRAFDIAPYHSDKPHIHYEDRDEFLEFAGFVRGIAASLGIDVTWGGDWDSDLDVNDQTFNDWVHWQIK